MNTAMINGLIVNIWGRVLQSNISRRGSPTLVRPFGESDLKRYTLHQRRSFQGLQELVCPPDFGEIAGV